MSQKRLLVKKFSLPSIGILFIFSYNFIHHLRISLVFIVTLLLFALSIHQYLLVIYSFRRSIFYCIFFLYSKVSVSVVYVCRLLSVVCWQRNCEIGNYGNAMQMVFYVTKSMYFNFVQTFTWIMHGMYRYLSSYEK